MSGRLFWPMVDVRFRYPRGSGLLPPKDSGPQTKGTRSVTTIAATIPKKYLQARSTAGILNIVRIVGTALFALNALGFAIYGIVEWADPNTSKFAVVLIPLGVLMWLVIATVFYAMVGWFADALSLLTQIAKNTTPKS
jgi:hypothetical protein